MIQNDPGFVELSLERLGDNFEIEEFLYAIRTNHTVRHVCFSGTFIRQLEPAQWSKILGSIGHLSSLEELQIWCSEIPVSVLHQTISRASKLQKFYFFRVKLAGSQEDFDNLATSLKHHPTLRDFRVGGFQITENVSLNSAVEALAETQSLQVVNLQLTGTRTAVPLSEESLGKLFSSATITDLYLSRLGLGEEHLSAIINGLATNDTLRVLDLFGNAVTNEHVIMIAKALETNSGLETLVLPCPADDMSVESCAAISQALKSNRKLLTLNLPRTQLRDEGILHIAEGLMVNTTLKKIEVGVSKQLGEKGNEALHKMLEQNYELERLVVSSAEKGIKEKVEHYMRLNEVGRGSLLRDGKATREQWVDMLISVSDDLDCLFYFTSVNPSLFQFANARGADVIITEEIRMRRRHTLNVWSVPLENDVPKEGPSRRASAIS